MLNIVRRLKNLWILSSHTIVQGNIQKDPSFKPKPKPATILKDDVLDIFEEDTKDTYA